MANFNNKGVQSIATNDTFTLGIVGAGYGNGVAIQFDKVGAFDGSIQLQARVAGATNYFPIPYTKKYLNGLVAADETVSVAITGNSIIVVNGEAGLELALVCTGRTVGSMDVTVGRSVG